MTQPIPPWEKARRDIQRAVEAAMPGIQKAVEDFKARHRLPLPSVVPPPPMPVDRGELFLAACVRNTRGLPYTWGGDTFRTFDCSALVVYGARELGIRMPRTTYDQINMGRSVRWEDRRIGDLIFSRFSGLNRPEHVSIYAGNDKVYEAGDPIGFYGWGSRGTVEVRRIV